MGIDYDGTQAIEFTRKNYEIFLLALLEKKIG